MHLNPEKLWKLIRIIVTMLYLMVGWILFTFSFKLSSILLGLFCSSLIALGTYDLFIDVQEAQRRAIFPKVHLLGILLLLVLKNILWSSIKMIPLVFTLNMTPRVVHLRTRLHSDIGRALLANFITITPGTLTIDLSGDNLLVHWLDAKTTHKSHAGKLIKDDMEKWIGKIWT